MEETPNGDETSNGEDTSNSDETPRASLSRAKSPHRVRTVDPLRLELVVSFAQEAQIADRICAAPRVREDVVDLQVVHRIATIACRPDVGASAVVSFENGVPRRRRDMAGSIRCSGWCLRP